MRPMGASHQRPSAGAANLRCSAHRPMTGASAAATNHGHAKSGAERMGPLTSVCSVTVNPSSGETQSPPLGQLRTRLTAVGSQGR